VTESCLHKQPIDAKTSDTAANNIVAFSRPVKGTVVRTRELALA